MIDLTATRALIVSLLSDTGIHVYTRAVTDTFVTPCVIIGIPEVEFDVQPCVDTTHLPIGVVVGRDGIDDAATQDQLEVVWRKVVDRLLTATRTGGFDPVAHGADLKRSEYESVGVQGATYPAMTLTLDLHR